MIESMILWLATRLKISTILVKLLLVGVAGAGIYFAIQSYKNHIIDETVIKTTVKISKKIAAEKEKEISAEREKNRKEEEKLLQNTKLFEEQKLSFEIERSAFNGSLKKAIETAEKTRELRYVQIEGEVGNIPGDKLDDSIRGLLSRYSPTSSASPSRTNSTGAESTAP